MSKLNIKKRFVAHMAEGNESGEDFGAALDNLDLKIKEGSVVKGQVVGVEKEIIIVDVGLKNEGRIPLEEFRAEGEDKAPSVGDIIEVFVEKIEGRNGRTILSREKAVREESWAILEESFKKGEEVTGFVVGRVKGGYTVDINGVLAFLPRSQSDIDNSVDPTHLREVPKQFKIASMDKNLDNIVVSRKAILDASRMEERQKFLSTVKEGSVLEGTVKNITDYGAFIDLGGIDGLLHVTDISWGRVNHPSEVLSIGRKVKVKVIKPIDSSGKISLGMKQLDDSMWRDIKEEFPIGKIMKGKITNVKDYGVFIELKNGIEGLVHSSEVSWIKSMQNPKKSLTIGQEVEFLVLEIDTEKHRISLSIKQCGSNPLIEFEKEHPVGSTVTGKIRNLADFGIFVDLGNNIEGMVHETDIASGGVGKELLRNFKKGDDIECKILSVDTEKDRISLGIRQLETESESISLEEFSKGSVHTCIVKTISKDGIEVEVGENGPICFIKKSDLALDKADQRADRFAPGDRVDAKITSLDKKSGKIALSVKALESEEREKAIKEYGSADSGASLGDILGAALESGSDSEGKKKK